MTSNSEPLDISRDVKLKRKQGSISKSNVKIIEEDDNLCSLFAYVCSKKCLLFKYILPAFVIIIIISFLQMANYLRTLRYDITEITPYLIYRLVLKKHTSSSYDEQVELKELLEKAPHFLYQP